MSAENLPLTASVEFHELAMDYRAARVPNAQAAYEKLCAFLEGREYAGGHSACYFDTDRNKKIAVVVGHEGVGVAADAADRRVVAVAGSVEPTGKVAAWIDQFGNVFPLGAYSPSGKPCWIDADKRGWKPLFREAAPQPVDAAQAVPEAQTDLAKRLSEMANSTNSEVSVLCVSKADLLALCSETNRYFGGMRNWKRTAEAKDAQMLAAPSQEVQPAAQGAVPEWFSVNDRLPEVETDVLVYGKRDISAHYSVAGIFTNDTHAPVGSLTGREWLAQNSEEELRFMVSHWMPLPAAPLAQPTDTTAGE